MVLKGTERNNSANGITVSRQKRVQTHVLKIAAYKDTTNYMLQETNQVVPYCACVFMVNYILFPVNVRRPHFIFVYNIRTHRETPGAKHAHNSIMLTALL
jgi:hypothetical protein